MELRRQWLRPRGLLSASTAAAPPERGILRLPFSAAVPLPIGVGGGTTRAMEATQVLQGAPSGPVHSIDDLLERMVARSASDLHLTVGAEPTVRVTGQLERMEEFGRLTPGGHPAAALPHDVDGAAEAPRDQAAARHVATRSPGLARFRVNIYFQRESLGAAFRIIPTELKTLEQLGVPKALEELADKPRGLVLVTGPTGSGKSTTLAAMIDLINRTRRTTS